MGSLALYLLGPPQILRDGTPVVGLASTKVRALLIYLALEPDRPHARPALAGLLWPDQVEAVAHHNLRQALANLRQALGDRDGDPPFLRITRETVQLNPVSDYWIDVSAFTQLLAACDTHPHRRATTCTSCAERRTRATALYRGDFLAHFFLSDSAAFEEWTTLTREHVRQQALHALARLSAYHLQREEYAAVQRAAGRQVELDPWDEEAHQQLMRGLWRSSQRRTALAHYEHYRRTLRRELGVEPTPETTALALQIRDTAPDVTARTMDVEGLPAPSTPFIGREAELAQLADLLQHPACRLITLTGPGGIGKTRLALQAAIDQRATFADGSSVVALAALNTPDLLVSTIATALNLALDGRADLTTQLLRYLRDKDLLLVLDSFEHLLSPAPSDPSAATGVVSTILRQAPRVTLLVTSRERLHLQGEWVVDVAGLPYPADTDREEIEGYGAVQLFVQAARRAHAGFALTAADAPWVARICRLVEGMPLGLELGAARVRVLTCRDIARELEHSLDVLADTLRDVPARQQSIRLVLAHSWDRLTLEEQRVLRQVAVFRGGVERAAAEQVAGASLPLLTMLVDKSLLRRSLHAADTCRFDLHELVRQFAEEHLVAAREADVLRERHAAYYVALAEALEPELIGRAEIAWLNRLEHEHDNVRAVLHWALQPPTTSAKAESGLRLAAAICQFWRRRGYLSEGRRWLDALLSLPNALPALVRAKVLRGAGDLAMAHDDLTRAEAWFAESRALCNQYGDRTGLAWSINNLGVVARSAGNYDRASALIEESLELFRRVADTRGTATALVDLSRVEAFQGNQARAAARVRESLPLFRAVGDRGGLAWACFYLGLHAMDQGDDNEAEGLQQESVTLFRDLGDQYGLAWALHHLALVAQQRRQYRQATSLDEESLARFSALRLARGMADVLAELARVAQIQGDGGQALARYRTILTLKEELEQTWWIAYALAGMAGRASAVGWPRRAARLYGAAEALRETLDAPPPAVLPVEYESDIRRARSQLDDAGWEVAWAEGRAMTLEQAIAYALEGVGHEEIRDGPDVGAAHPSL